MRITNYGEIEESERILDADALSGEVMEASIEIRIDLSNHGPLRMILERAKGESFHALQSLITVNPTDSDMVRDLQWKARRYQMLCSWIAEIIGDGKLELTRYNETQITDIVSAMMGEDGQVGIEVEDEEY